MNLRIVQVLFISACAGILNMSAIVFDRDYFDFLLESGKVHQVDEYFHSHGWSSISKSPFDAASPVEHRQSLEWLEEQAFKKGHIHMIYRLFERFAYYHGSKQEVHALRAYKYKLFKYRLVALKLLNSYQEHFSRRAKSEDNHNLLATIAHVLAAYTNKFDTQPMDWTDVSVEYQNNVEAYAEKRAQKIIEPLSSVFGTVESVFPGKPIKKLASSSMMQSSCAQQEASSISIDKDILKNYLYYVYWLRHISPTQSYGGSWSLSFNDKALEDSLIQAGVIQVPFVYEPHEFSYVDSDTEGPE